MRIAFIGDKKGKVHYNRYEAFSLLLREYTTIDFFEVKNLPKRIYQYDIVYFASFTLLGKIKLKHPKIYGSVTSWKCIREKKDLSLLNLFGKISVNNLALWKEIKHIYHSAVCIPNGVDANFFSPFSNHCFDPSNVIIGWVGNRDREEKGYKSILCPVKNKLSNKCVSIKEIATSKSSKTLKSQFEMREFYRSIDFYLVTSYAEGTPNPALEAAACGVPVISTPVGNMPELIIEGKNGFFIECNIENIVNSLCKLPTISQIKYKMMSDNIRGSILNGWSWNCRKDILMDFFGLA